MAPLPPPPHPIASSVPSLRWPLRNLSTSMPPLHYLRPDEMTELRAKSATPQRETHTEWMNNVPNTISTMFDGDSCGNSSSQLRYDYAILSLSILLLGHGYTDEAHSLVTPYSWPDQIHTSYGPVRYDSSDSGVVSVATYVHSLVHRKEGWNVGELGMVGWANADYWGGAWSRPLSVREELRAMWQGPIGDIKRTIQTLAGEHSAGREWCHEHMPELLVGTESNGDATSWDPRALHRLCAQVTKEGGDVGEDLIVFAEKAVEAELRALLRHCVGKAGYETSWLAEA